MTDGKPPRGSAGASRRRVLITGAAGNIGCYFARHARRFYDLRLLIHPQNESADRARLRGCGEIVVGDIQDLSQLAAACRGVETVIHLAGNPSPDAGWDTLLPINIAGTYNTFLAAKAAGCRRVIYASSIHAVSGYPADVQVKTTDAVNPGDLYGVSKCFGEALARYMAEQEGLSCLVLRIGAFQPRVKAREQGALNMLDAWISRRDMNHLLRQCIEVENLPFAILHALSDNRFKRLDITDTRAKVGFAPKDDLTRQNHTLRDLHLDQVIAQHSLQDARQHSGIAIDLERARIAINLPPDC